MRKALWSINSLGVAHVDEQIQLDEGKVIHVDE